MNERITNAASLAIGDVVQVAVEMRDRQTGGTYWWKRFACVVEPPRFYTHHLLLLTLKMHPVENDLRQVDIRKDVVTRLPEDQWPQGVIAMRMKYILQGRIKLDEG